MRAPPGCPRSTRRIHLRRGERELDLRSCGMTWGPHRLMAVERADNFPTLLPACYPGVGPRYCGKQRIDMLRFHTLGSFELLEGQPPAVRLIPTQPKRLALLAYLALAHPRGFHRRDTPP